MRTISGSSTTPGETVEREPGEWSRCGRSQGPPPLLERQWRERLESGVGADDLRVLHHSWRDSGERDRRVE